MNRWLVLVLVLVLVPMVLAAPAAFPESVLVGSLPRQAELRFRTSEVEGGLAVEHLEPGSPAAEGGLREGDVIVRVGGTSFAHGYEGEDLLRRLDGGAEARLTVRRGADEIDVGFFPVPRPLEALDGVVTTYGELQAPDGSRLRTLVSRPEGASGPLPALFFVQWVSCGTIEVLSESATHRVLRALAERSGMVLLRVERSAAGDSEGPGCHELDYDTEVEHYRFAFDALTASEAVNPERVVVLGMSLGGTVAPLVAAGKDVDGVAVSGGGALTYFERMVRFDRIHLERRPAPPETIHETMLRHILFHTEYLLGGKTPEQIEAERPDLAEVWSEILGAGDGVHYGRPYAYHQQAAKRDFLEAWAGIDAPVLVVYGEFDQFETRHGHEVIATTVNRLRPGTARFVQIDRMDHDYGVYATAEDAYSWTYGPSAPGHDAPELVIGELLRWMKYDVGVESVKVN